MTSKILFFVLRFVLTIGLFGCKLFEIDFDVMITRFADKVLVKINVSTSAVIARRWASTPGSDAFSALNCLHYLLIFLKLIYGSVLVPKVCSRNRLNRQPLCCSSFTKNIVRNDMSLIAGNSFIQSFRFTCFPTFQTFLSKVNSNVISIDFFVDPIDTEFEWTLKNFN